MKEWFEVVLSLSFLPKEEDKGLFQHLEVKERNYKMINEISQLTLCVRIYTFNLYITYFVIAGNLKK